MNWEQLLSISDRTTISYSKAKDESVDRIVNKYKKIIRQHKINSILK